MSAAVIALPRPPVRPRRARFGSIAAQYAEGMTWAVWAGDAVLHVGLGRDELVAVALFWESQPAPSQPAILEALGWLARQMHGASDGG